MGRSPCCSKEGLNRGAWTALEDKILTDYIKAHGDGRWRNLPKKAGLKRCGKSCRLRWLNYLRPDIKRGNISPDEEELIIRLHKLLGNRWALIAGRLPGRTDNEIKNYWNTNLSKKVQDRPQNRRPWKEPSETDEKKIDRSPIIVRARASKCSKVVIHDFEPQKIQHCSSNLEMKPSVNVEMTDKKDVESMSATRENNQVDFMMDFNLEEFCLPELINSELLDFCEKFNYSNNSGTSNLWPSSNQPLIFSEEMLQDLNVNDSVQEFVSSNLNQFTSFLDL